MNRLFYKVSVYNYFNEWAYVLIIFFFKDNVPETGVVISFLPTVMICFSSSMGFFVTPGTLKGRLTNQNTGTRYKKVHI